MQVASTITATACLMRKSRSSGPNETVRVSEAQRPCLRPVTVIVARFRIGAALKLGWR
jgi:hypothetical protein